MYIRNPDRAHALNYDIKGGCNRVSVLNDLAHLRMLLELETTTNVIQIFFTQLLPLFEEVNVFDQLVQLFQITFSSLFRWFLQYFL